MDLTIVVPIYNEVDSLQELSSWIDSVLKGKGLTYEVLMIDDGSKDGSWSEIEQLSKRFSNIKGIRFRRNYGKSAALNKGFEAAYGDVVITMDADLQDSPEEIPELYRLIMDEKNDIVSGWKRKRHDPINKRIPSKLYNRTVRLFTGIKLHDFNCGLKAYRQDVVKSIEVFGEMHRYIPVIAKSAGFTKITEKEVQHQARKHGTSKYGAERYVKGFLDLITITFLSKYMKRPMHFFGLLGTLLFLAGFGILTYFTIGKFAWNLVNMTDRPLFHLGTLSIMVGAIFFVGGFLAEIVGRSHNERNTYLVSKTCGFGNRSNHYSNDKSRQQNSRNSRPNQKKRTPNKEEQKSNPAPENRNSRKPKQSNKTEK